MLICLTSVSLGSHRAMEVLLDGSATSLDQISSRVHVTMWMRYGRAWRSASLTGCHSHRDLFSRGELKRHDPTFVPTEELLDGLTSRPRPSDPSAITRYSSSSATALLRLLFTLGCPTLNTFQLPERPLWPSLRSLQPHN